MNQKSKSAQSKLLTDVELEMMNIIWGLGSATVKDVLESLPKKRQLAYTSVSTMLRILEQKKILKSEKQGRGHVYTPQLPKEDYEVRSVRHLLEGVFKGNTSSLVRSLLNTKNLNQDELNELKKLIERESK